jgi:hypothetical protein
VIGENLDTEADDERHEEKVQKVLHPWPRGKAGVTARAASGTPG